jgi:sigma-B regulation protein RsbU (phosphoserine phosphatase)
MSGVTKPRVLVADDQIDVLEAMRLLLKGAGYATEVVDSPAGLLASAAAAPFDVILMDMNYRRDTTSGEEGLELLEKLLSHEDPPPIIVMTAWSSVDLAVEAMRRGASDFVQKPWDNDKLLGLIEKHVKRSLSRRDAQSEAKSELEIARHVQQRLLPQEPLTIPTLSCAGRCIPARQVGGDYYDFLDLEDGKLGVLLADVSGKGIASALLMANLQASFRSQPPDAWRNSRNLLAQVHRRFHDSKPAEFFVTLFLGHYDSSTRTLRYVNCGHPAPVLQRASGVIERLEATALPLGVLPMWTGEEQSTVLGPGDTLVVFSDGAVEAGLDTDHPFDEAKLVEEMSTFTSATVDGLLDHLIEKVIASSGDHQFDDLTLVGLRGC